MSRLLFHATQNPPDIYRSQLNGTDPVTIVKDMMTNMMAIEGIAVYYNVDKIVSADSGKSLFSIHALYQIVMYICM